MINENVLNDRLRPCTGCGACLLVCPTNAISFVLDGGFYKPIICPNKCVKCGKCKKVCYSHQVVFNNNNKISAFYGYLNSESNLLQSSSGGLSFAIANYLFQKGYKVIGCKYNNITKNSEHFLVKSATELSLMRGSKYFQSNTFEVLKEIKTMPDKTKIAFFGTPCQVFGIKKAFEILGISNDAVFIEIFCHGITSPLLWQKYLKSVKNNDDVRDVLFRTKDYGWHIPCNAFIFKNGSREITKRTGDIFFELYYSTMVFNRACYSCECKKNFGMADIRLGDYWGHKFNDNQSGVSCILTLSQKGEEIIQLLSGSDVCICETDLKDIFAGQSFERDHSFKNDIYNKVINILIDPNSNINDVKKIAFKNYSLMYRIKRYFFAKASNLKNKIWKKQ